MPNSDQCRPAVAGPSHASHSAAPHSHIHHDASQFALAHRAISSTTTSLKPRNPGLHSKRHYPSIKDAVQCSKPPPSVPKDIDADDGLDDDGSELVHQHRPSFNTELDAQIESDISSASASSTTSSSMETDWHETSLRNQVARLDIKYTDFDLGQTEPPSVFGLRRRIVAAALDHVAQRGKDQAEGPMEGRQFEERGLCEWLSLRQSSSRSSSSQWKDKILRKKMSFGSKKTKAAFANQTSTHEPMPHSAALSYTGSGSTHSPTSPHDKMLKRDKELAERESNFDLVVLSRFETAELRMQIYTEHRQGSWVVKGPAPAGSNVLDEPPLVYSPWDCQIDSRGIVERNKLRSFIELSDTTCALRCSNCASSQHGILLGCSSCGGSGAVTATYVVCVTLRQSTFLPLTMQARHKAGKVQNAFRSYLPRTTTAMSHVDLLRMRSLEAVRSNALRVGRAHHKEHEARLLMAKATLERRSCNSVAVINRTNGLFRTFDITDGGFVRGHPTPGVTDEESKIVEMPRLSEALARLRVTTIVNPEGTYRFVDLELVDMATSKELSMLIDEARSGGGSSVYTCGSGGSTDDSYSPSAFSFFQRATEPKRYGGNRSRDSQTLKGNKGRLVDSRPRIAVGEDVEGESRSPLNFAALHITNPGDYSSASSLRSFQSAQGSKSSMSPASSLGAPNKPWVRTTPGSPGPPGSPALTAHSVATSASFLTAMDGAGGSSIRSGSSGSSGTVSGRGYGRMVGA